MKSEKSRRHEACYVPDVRGGEALSRVARRFLELPAENLVGGIVLRAFEAYEPGELRTWWHGQDCVLTCAHPDTADATVPDDLELLPIAKALGTLEVQRCTVDLAKSPAGWRIVEVGDAQVSGRPPTLPAAVLLEALEEGGL